MLAPTATLLINRSRMEGAIGDIRELVRSDKADPLSPFAETCRVELESLRAA